MSKKQTRQRNFFLDYLNATIGKLKLWDTIRVYQNNKPGFFLPIVEENGVIYESGSMGDVAITSYLPFDFFKEISDASTDEINDFQSFLVENQMLLFLCVFYADKKHRIVLDVYNENEAKEKWKLISQEPLEEIFKIKPTNNKCTLPTLLELIPDFQNSRSAFGRAIREHTKWQRCTITPTT